MKNLRFCSVLATALAREMARWRRIFCSLFLVAAVVAAAATSHISKANPQNGTRALTFSERVAYQRAIEEVYWRHRIWPSERPDLKPGLDAVMSQAQLEEKVEAYLRKSRALEDYQRQPLTAEQLQAEMDRMAQHTKQLEVLRELFEALGNDPFVIAECLARPALAEHFHADLSAQNNTRHCESMPIAWLWSVSMPGTFVDGAYTLPKIPDQCIDDVWTTTSTTNAPDGRSEHTAVWTGSEMIVWGGAGPARLATGGRYIPSTDSWIATSTANAPSPRSRHTAVWTGIEMIVWGGIADYPNTGGRYNPSTDSWTATSTTNAPNGRREHTAVWTGSEMIVWGGCIGLIQCFNRFNTGGRYNPSTDSWTATSTISAPAARRSHTAVWTGSEMIVWGGYDSSPFNTGGRYNPNTDSWTATSTTDAPDDRTSHTAVWTGSEMIVWGGRPGYLNTGGRYNPNADNWTATSLTNAPDARIEHTAAWTGSQMIVWGGVDSDYFDTGGRYNPNTDSWTATGTTDAPDGRTSHTAVWTGSEMIVWGGYNGSYLNTGGRYCAGAPSPTPTPTPTATATPTATPTPRTSPTPKPRPTPAPRL